MIWQGRLIENYLKSLPIIERDDISIEYSLTLSTQYKQKGADIVSVIHEMIDLHIKNTPFDIAEMVGVLEEADQTKAKNGYLAFLKWERETNPEWIHNEKMVYSRKYGYVGTFDAIARINGKIYLVDFKSASGFYEMDHRLQTSAYAMAYMEEFPEEIIEGRLIILCTKEDKEKDGKLVAIAGEVQVYEISDEMQEDFVAFISAKNLFQRNKKFADNWKK